MNKKNTKKYNKRLGKNRLEIRIVQLEDKEYDFFRRTSQTFVSCINREQAHSIVSFSIYLSNLINEPYEQILARLTGSI